MKKADIKQSRLLLNMKETILIKESEIPKDIEVYGNLFNILQNYDNLSEHDLITNNSFDKKAIATLANEQVRKVLIELVKDEWHAIECNETSGEKIPCQLCHTPNKKIYYIRNRHNNNELHVGSDCIRQFPGIENLKIVHRDFKEREKIKKQEIRRVEFAELESDDPEFIARSRKNFYDINIVLPYSLHNCLDQILYDLSFLRTNYIQHGGNMDEISNKYITLKDEFKVYWSQAIEHYQRYHKNKLACNKQMSDWLNDKHQDIWIKVSQNNGLFDENTLKYAYNSNYVSKHIPIFKRCLCDTSIKIIDVNNNSLRFSISDENYHYPVHFTMSNKSFMELIGCKCLISKQYEFNRNDLTDILIEETSSNFEALHNRMMGIMKKVNMDIIRGDFSGIYYFKKLSSIIKVSKCGAISQKFLMWDIKL